jgi:hypothetical protein
VTANRAEVPATHRSHIWASRNPPPKAGPLTAATTGLVTWMFRPRLGVRSRGGTVRPRAAISLRSAPAQNASPAPVRTSTAAPGSASNRRNPSHSPAATARLMALRASGRSIISQTTPSVSS